jgi:hypothetical protein
MVLGNPPLPNSPELQRCGGKDWVGRHAFFRDSPMSPDRSRKRDLHALNEDGMVLCNPRDKEAAHRAEMEGIATEDHAAVTCSKCLSLLYKLAKDQNEGSQGEF